MFKIYYWSSVVAETLELLLLVAECISIDSSVGVRDKPNR